MSESILEKSLDDIIGDSNTDRKQPRRERPARGGSRGGRGSFRGNDSRSSRGSFREGRGGRDGRDNREGRGSSDRYREGRGISKPTYSHHDHGDKYNHRSAGSSLPRDIVSLAGSRPVLRVKNIHPDLNGEDLSNLFGTISPVDFVKFDNKDDSVAYVCFQSDNIKSNADAIKSYDGKKAMGEYLIVENATSLVDRITSNPLTRRIHPVSERQHERRKHDRSTERGPKGVRDAKPKPAKREKKEKPVKKDATALDLELEAYMNGGASVVEASDEPAFTPADEMNLD